MPRWRVGLDGDTFDLEDLPALFSEPMATVVLAEDGNYYLDSDQFDDLDSPVEVRSSAGELLRLVNGVLLAQSGSYESVSVGSKVVEFASDGTQHGTTVVDLGMLHERSKVLPMSVVISGAQQVAATGPPASAQILELAGNDDDVRDALLLWGTHPHDWFTLYKVFEIMGKPNHPDKSRFTQTANHPGGSGEQARHGRMGSAPPVDPMPLGEARGMIRLLLDAWLRSRLASATP